jgi:ubiquinone/menaquinone biosynthesis C-methylase UbiE
MSEADAEAQRAYYERTAANYDDMHVEENDEHFRALDWLSSLIRQHKIESLLDVGAGTGRAMQYLKDRNPIRTLGVEPVEALRAAGHAKGIAEDELVDGNALALPFADDSFDVVSEFGVLHHIKDHRRAVREMCRVAKRGVLLSDSNNFGQGSPLARFVKQSINAVGMWPAFDWVMTKGKGYHWSEGDGLFYSYSLINDLPVIRAKFPKLHFFGTLPATGPDFYRHAPHMAVFATR